MFIHTGTGRNDPPPHFVPRLDVDTLSQGRGNRGGGAVEATCPHNFEAVGRRAPPPPPQLWTVKVFIFIFVCFCT